MNRQNKFDGTRFDIDVCVFACVCVGGIMFLCMYMCAAVVRAILLLITGDYL